MSGKWHSGLTSTPPNLSPPYRHVVRDLSGRVYPADLTHYYRKWDALGARTLGLREESRAVDYPANRVVIVAVLVIAAIIILFAVV